MSTLWFDAVEFENRGGWYLDTQFVYEMGQAYLMAADKPGVPVTPATHSFVLPDGGKYRLWVRTKNWKAPEAPGKFKISVDGKELDNICGAMPATKWYWEIAGNTELEAGEHSLEVNDLTGWLSRFSAVIITDDMDFTPSPEIGRLLKQRAEIKNTDTAVLQSSGWDFVVIGAGPGGIPAAVSAARAGLKTALINSRPHIGGNSSDEGTIGYDGAACHNPGMCETGIANEIKNTKWHYDITWQKAAELLTENESNLTVFNNMLCVDARVENNKILSAVCVDTLTLQKTEFSAKFFADCSGDGWLGYFSGAEYRIGREARCETGEQLAPRTADTLTMSGCICGITKEGNKKRSFYAEDTGKPVDFILPDFAVKLPEGDKLFRKAEAKNIAEWWLENSNDYDDLFDAEYSRDTLIRLALGYFDWLKNSDATREKMRNYELKELALYNSKRENRRIIGDYVLTQNDCTEKTKFDDAVSYSGWAIDLHHPKGIFSGEEGVFYKNIAVGITEIPYRCLYSKNIGNLFVASRCASFTHIALGTARVESTLATLGQVVGTAAWFCVKNEMTPREVGKSYITQLKQRLLKDDLTVPHTVNEDDDDLARNATVTATAKSDFEPLESINDNFIRIHGHLDIEKLKTDASGNILSSCCPENIINGKIRGTLTESNAWYCDTGVPQSVTLSLEKPSVISQVRITADTDLVYPSVAFRKPRFYPKTATELSVEVYSNNNWHNVGNVKDNFLRKIVVNFDPIKAERVRVTVMKSTGESIAKIIEVRIY